MQRGAFGLEPLTPRRRGGALLGVAEQASLDLGLALGQHPAALGQRRPPGPRAPGTAAVTARRRSASVAPRRGRLFDLGQGPDEPLALGLYRHQPLAGLGQGLAGGRELLAQAAHLVLGPLGLGGRVRPRRGVTIKCPVGLSQGIAGLGQGHPAAGQVGPGRVGQCRRFGAAPLRLLDRSGRHHAGRRAHAPPGGGEAIPLGGHHDEIVALEGEIDGLLPPVDPDGMADQRIEHGLGDRLAVTGPHVAAHRSGPRDAGRKRRWRGCREPASPCRPGAPTRRR